MSGEYLQAQTIEEYWEKLKAIYQSRAQTWQDLNKNQYEAIERSERTDSDNEYNQNRLGKDTDVIDLAYYKYLPGRVAAYHIQVISLNGQKADYYFQIELKPAEFD